MQELRRRLRSLCHGVPKGGLRGLLFEPNHVCGVGPPSSFGSQRMAEVASKKLAYFFRTKLVGLLSILERHHTEAHCRPQSLRDDDGAAVSGIVSVEHDNGFGEVFLKQVRLRFR